MAIVVQEASDADLRRACEIETAAYANNPSSPILFPGPFPPDSPDRRVNNLINMRKDDPSARYLKAVKDETGEMTAFAKWHIYDTPEAAELARERPINIGPGMNKEACEAFFGGMAMKKKEIMGTKRHLYLHMLHTDPKYQCCGAGSALLKWGMQKADELGLPVYLESSTEGHHFYQKHGFKDVDVLRIDFSQFGGGDVMHVAPLMIREPEKTT
ncbi:acyl-CoA N-acyltransferase [Trematosphaeria pertusa]|uniref:Acyl-CoA N-acyltransferase n=1 Tax=Trematosphaeria pertusa TaxID=390896 RepID=A0A6A6ITA6_9PLEO|nr:acyl-CoA N-acyltransferase [Trematosphaeria pertusa]KAF2253765.1 acyl-CoA N-acyltransferase [Trematosphaeria pertusa]